MFSSIVAWLSALFVIGPLRAEISTYLQYAKVPVEAVAHSRRCLESYGPLLCSERVKNQDWAATAMGVAIGTTSPAQLLDEGDPNCSTLIKVFQIDYDQDQNSGA